MRTSTFLSLTRKQSVRTNRRGPNVLPGWSTSVLRPRPISAQSLCGSLQRPGFPTEQRPPFLSNSRHIHSYILTKSSLKDSQSPHHLFDRVSLTRSFQQTEVTESPSTDKSHNLVTCGGKRKPHVSGHAARSARAEMIYYGVPLHTWLVQALHRYTQAPSPTLSRFPADQSTC